MTDDRDNMEEEQANPIEADFSPEDTDDSDEPQEGLVVASDLLPTTLPIIPLRPRPAFPGILTPMVFTGDRHVAPGQTRRGYAKQNDGSGVGKRG